MFMIGWIGSLKTYTLLIEKSQKLNTKYNTAIIKIIVTDLSVKGVIENFLFTKNILPVFAANITIKVAKANPSVPKSNS